MHFKRLHYLATKDKDTFKIDYFENNLDNTLNDNTEKIIETYRNDMSVLKNDIANINSEINDIDSLFLKLQGSWFTKRILK